MPSRIPAWGVYDIFEVAGGEQIFLAVVSDGQWASLCNAFGFADLKDDPRLATNNLRVAARGWMMPLLRERMAVHRAAEIGSRFEANGLPWAPITRPHDLFDDPHLLATGGLAPVTLPDGRDTRTPLLPITLDGRRPPLRSNPPAIGEHTEALLQSLGLDPTQILALRTDGVIAPTRTEQPPGDTS
jgi:crotonobetainyl-CoA:carnitine CoA-transferase CaiB-like acyl-CoA transferase